jgi:hypothetical protein
MALEGTSQQKFETLKNIKNKQSTLFCLAISDENIWDNILNIGTKPLSLFPTHVEVK